MKHPEYTGDDWALYQSDCVEVLSTMPSDSVDLAVFSPPFSSLYIYSASERDMGNCGSHDEFLTQYRYLCDALYQAMKPGHIVAVHVKDLVYYANSSETETAGLYPFSDECARIHRDAGFDFRARITVWRNPVREMQKTKNERLLYKNLRANSRVSAMGMPEYILVFRKQSAGVKIGEPVQHTHDSFTLDQWQEWASPVWPDTRETDVLNARFRGNRDEKHICPMPLDLIERLIVLYSNPGDVVMDPFNGIGSTGYVALKHGRKYVGCELKPEYAALAARFLAEAESSRDDLFRATA